MILIVIPNAIIDAIFAECDRYDSHETGGALIGTYRGSRDDLTITVAGVIGAGPNARRSATSFFKDGDYQERRFREIERIHPSIEHLGNWHTHHVNGYPTLSPGDCVTYHKNVNSKNHNTDFWYAFLVTNKTGRCYSFRHYILYRDDPKEYEIPSEQLAVVDRPILCAQ
jgi:hypothetical protein